MGTERYWISNIEDKWIALCPFCNERMSWTECCDCGAEGWRCYDCDVWFISNEGYSEHAILDITEDPDYEEQSHELTEEEASRVDILWNRAHPYLVFEKFGKVTPIDTGKTAAFKRFEDIS